MGRPTTFKMWQSVLQRLTKRPAISDDEASDPLASEHKDDVSGDEDDAEPDRVTGDVKHIADEEDEEEGDDDMDVDDDEDEEEDVCVCFVLGRIV